MNAPRYIIAVRLSRMTDETTSPQRQLEAGRTCIDVRSGVEVGVAEDLDVSASKIGPFERKGLGPWLKERFDEYDGIIWSRLDRAVRSMGDLHELAKWAHERKKKLMFASGPGGGMLELDMSDPFNQIIMTILAFAAQLEAQNISERVTGAHAYLRQRSRWGGGTYPYWCMPVRVDPNNKSAGWKLEIDPETAPIVREMITRAIRGEAMLAIARDFEKRGIPTPRDYRAQRTGKEREQPYKWSSTAVAMILKSKALLGELIFDGQIIRDETGEPLKRCEALVTEREWEALQAALAKRALPEGRPSNPNVLLGVLRCSNCGNKLYRQQTVKKGNPYVYLRCHAYMTQHTDCNERFRGEAIEKHLIETFLATVGHLEVQRREYVPGHDNSEAMTAVERKIADLEREKDDPDMLMDYDTYKARKQPLLRRREDLLAQGSRKGGFQNVSTGVSYAQFWATAAVEDRQALLRESEVIAYAGRSHALEFAKQACEKYGDADPGTFAIVDFGPSDLGTRDLHLSMLWTGDIVQRMSQVHLPS